MTASLASAPRNGQLLAKLARPQNVLYPGILAGIAAHLGQANWRVAVLCYLLIAGLYSVAVAINNLQDVAVDQANQRLDNPLASGKMPLRLVAGFVAVNVLAVVVAQPWLRQPASLLLSLVYVMLLLAYSVPKISLQSRGFVATLCLSLCYGSLPLLIGSAQGSLPLADVMMAAGLQVLLLAPLLLAKDYKDLAGDKLFGKRTPLVRYGITGVRWAVGCLLAAYWLALIILITQSPRYEHFFGGLVAASLSYCLLVSYIHYKNGRRHLVVTRVTQFSLICIAYQLLRVG